MHSSNRNESISSAIVRFNKKLEEIKKIDRAFLYPSASVVALMVMNSITWGGIILASLYFGNRSLRQEYQDTLHSLVQIYNEFKNEKIEVATQDHDFLKLAETLAPYLLTKDLLLWPNEQLYRASEKFAAINIVKNPKTKKLFTENVEEIKHESLFTKITGYFNFWQQQPAKPKKNTMQDTTPSIEDYPDFQNALTQFKNIAWFHFYGYQPKTKHNTYSTINVLSSKLS